MKIVGKGGSGMTFKRREIGRMSMLKELEDVKSEKSKVENEKMLKLFGNDKRVKTSNTKRPGRYSNRKGSWERFGRIQSILKKKS